MSDDPLLTVAEVAVECAVHPETVRRAIRSGRLRAAALGEDGRDGYRVRREWMNEWVDRSARGSELSREASPPQGPRRRPRGRLAVTEGMGKVA